MILPRTSLILLLTAIAAVAETRVAIEGMTRRSSGEVLDLMGGRLEHIRSSDASAARADDAAFLVRQVLEKDGYVEVRVAWKIVSRNQILLTVNEGPRLSLGTVTDSPCGSRKVFGVGMPTNPGVWRISPVG